MLDLSLNDPEKLYQVTRALASEARLSIISLLNKESLNIQQLSEILNAPMSTIASHVKVLEEAGLIITELRPAQRGAMKVCTKAVNDLKIALHTLATEKSNEKVYEMDMPIGQFTDYSVSPTCGMADGERNLIPEDKPAHFFTSDRLEAQLIWTRKGFFEYKFPLEISKQVSIREVEISLEICSEAPNYDMNWPSDITVWMNGVDIGTWLCPSDFGDRPGKLNSKKWSESNSTQYGVLKTWKVTPTESLVDDQNLSTNTLHDLNVLERDYLTFRIGLKEDAINKGGLNVFGRKHGDYPQDIKLKIIYTDELK